MMRCLYLLIFCWTALAQQAEPTMPGRLSGSTVNSKGDPLHRSTVKLVGPKAYTQTTDEHGGFVFDNVAPGTYALLASHRGYYTQKFGGPQPLVTYCGTPEPAEEEGLAASSVLM